MLGPCGDPVGTILYNFLNKNHESIKQVFAFVYLPRGSFALPSRGWGGAGTILGIRYISYIVIAL